MILQIYAVTTMAYHNVAQDLVYLALYVLPLFDLLWTLSNLEAVAFHILCSTF